MTRVVAIATALLFIVGRAVTKKDFDWSANAPAKDDKILIFVGGTCRRRSGRMFGKSV
jgi:hypothetical protein